MQPERSVRLVRAVRQALLVRSGPLPRTERSVPWARWALPVRWERVQPEHWVQSLAREHSARQE